MPPTTPLVTEVTESHRPALQWKHNGLEWTITVYKQFNGSFVANARHRTTTGSHRFNCEDISEAGAIKRAKRMIKSIKV